jgi:hypothetical protein
MQDLTLSLACPPGACPMGLERAVTWDRRWASGDGEERDRANEFRRECQPKWNILGNQCTLIAYT